MHHKNIKVNHQKTTENQLSGLKKREKREIIKKVLDEGVTDYGFSKKIGLIAD